MVENSTDEDEMHYPVFNEKTDMIKPTSKLRMYFKDATLFRQVVKKHAIIERRPIVNYMNFRKKVQYVCQKSCEYKICASQNKKTSTYWIKIRINKHTYMPT